MGINYLIGRSKMTGQGMASCQGWHVVILGDGLLERICVEATIRVSVVGEKLFDSFHSDFSPAVGVWESY